jgi:hypothetical protein
MAGQAEATQVAGLGEDRELIKQNGSRIQSRNNDVVVHTKIPSRFAVSIIFDPTFHCLNQNSIIKQY